MAQITCELPDEVYQSLQDLAAKAQRRLEDVVIDAIRNYVVSHRGGKGPHSVIDIPDGRTLGAFLSPGRLVQSCWKTILSGIS